MFISAALGVAVTPGVGSLYVFTRTLAGGWREGLATVLGTTLGGSVHVLLVAFGGAAILGRDPERLRAITIGGGFFLAYLGLRGLLRSSVDPTNAESASRAGRALPEGILVALLNPTTAIFLLAFLPQFVEPTRPPLPQLLGLGGIFVAFNAGVHLTWVYLGARAEGAATRWPRVRSGLHLVGHGALLTLAAYALARAL